MDLAYIPSPSESVWHLGPIPIRAYALCLIAGIVAACWIAEARMRSRGAPKWAVLDLAVWAVPFGIVGARLYHVFSSPDAYFGPDGDPWKALAVWEGGLGIPGAVALGAVGVWLGCRQLKLPFALTADAIVPGIPVGQAIGRLGNWFNQELYGKPLDTWWAVSIDFDHRVAGYAQYGTFHPTFLYELLWNVGVALAVLLADRKAKFGAGRAVALYVALYGIGRFWIEGLRIDPAEDFAGLRLNQWMSVIVVVLAVAYLIFARGTRQVFVLDGGERVTVDWDSAEATTAGYVNGALPKGTEPGEIESAAQEAEDEPEPDRPEDDVIPDEPTAEEPSAGAGKPRDDS
ncbi:prolipoprotein diacylglyceryl transferase [Glycomyces algeriensis]|uniref:Phosphatidylglycerol--prolipoprotein diacylglyceryl transferase n=1 Tax=Glycomyces algeriensis TaxID=256037 RepID=A0A9W6G7E6_9ACTN|nr:prolipoprotein diacylglyceryl transferase [Glycomyces algeriensis]MDA1365089.1 prolipoprotein diacylglyceryl transferase [Glycomyces algeriensis]MDR7349849.1 prolipoprotein diacylglyceryl transferase [Glycomyces algeriensis]GLI42560.1 prolipoprotein diacylglyceryl transferase 2 [Glycomyces algeriensis]